MTCDKLVIHLSTQLKVIKLAWKYFKKLQINQLQNGASFQKRSSLLQLLNAITHLLQDQINCHEDISKDMSKILHISRNLLTLLTHALNHGTCLCISKFL